MAASPSTSPNMQLYISREVDKHLASLDEMGGTPREMWSCNTPNSFKHSSLLMRHVLMKSRDSLRSSGPIDMPVDTPIVAHKLLQRILPCPSSPTIFCAREDNNMRMRATTA